MNALDLIENDFKILSNELKKRNGNIKDIEQVLQPLAHVFESKNPRVFLPALNCLQKLASSITISDVGLFQFSNKIMQAGIISILTMLKDASNENTDEMTQIKILQILLIFLNPNTLRLSKEFVDLMFYSKSNSVKSTIQATLRQLFTLVFDKLVFKCRELAQNDDFFDTKRRLYLSVEERSLIISKIQTIEGDIIFKIIIDLLANLSRALQLQEQNDKKGHTQQIWNLAPSIHSKCMIMDIICLILNQTQDILQFFPIVLRIFDNELIPVLENMYKSKQPQEYVIGMRLMKCSILVINFLGIGVNLFTHILSETDNFLISNKFGKSNNDTQANMNLNWKSLIGFECVAIALNNPSLIKVFAQSALQVGKTVLVQVLESLIQASDYLDLSGDINQKHMLNPHYSHQKTLKFIEAQILESELPPPTPSQIHKLIIESACSFVDNMILIFDQYGLKIGGVKTSASNNNSGLASKMPASNQKQTMNDIDCKDLLLLSWKPLLMVLQNLLRLTNEESNIQMLLNCYQNFIGVCGSVYCYESRDGFLESLCSFCLTEQNALQPLNKQNSQAKQESTLREYVLTDKNVQICKTLLNIAHCLGYILDVKSWYIILETMQRIETVIKNRIKSKGKGATANSNNPTQPVINQSGNQTLVDFNEIKQKVLEKMKEYNFTERYSIQKDSKKKSIIQKEERKIDISENAQEEKKEGSSNQPLERQSVTAKRGSVQESGSKSNHQRLNSTTSKNSTVTHIGSEQMIQSSSSKVYFMFQNFQDKTFSSQYDSTSVSNQNSHHQSFDNLNSDLQILQDSFDSLFTSSYMFDQQSLAELITSLGQLTVGVLENINTNKKSNTNQMPSSANQDKGVRGASSKHQPNEGDILANINNFAITRLVETALVNISRIELVWKILIAHFDILSNCKVQTLRQLSIEAQLCIILEIFAYRKDKKNTENKNPFNNANSPPKKSQKNKTSICSSSDDVDQDMDFDVDENWSGTVWQYTILTPFSDQLKSQHQSNNLQTLNGIKKIIQTCGQQLKNDGWRIIILTISKSAEYVENDEILSTGFKCLQLIVSNYIDKLSQENFITILHGIHKYASNDGDNINNNLISVGMLQNIADYTAKMIVKEMSASVKESNNDQQFNAQRIWSILFDKIQELGGNHRAEIRRANIFTLENIIMTHGQLLSDQVWTTILKSNLLNMLKNSIDMYVEQKGGSLQKSKTQQIEAGLPTPSFSSGGWETKKRGGAGGAQARRMKFDEEAVKALQKNNDEQWEETCILLVQTVLRSIKKYNQLEHKNNELTDYAWINSIHIIIDMIKNGSQEICSTIFKSLEDLLSQANCVSKSNVNIFQVDLFMNNIKESFKIFEATSEWLVLEKQDTVSIIRKPMTLKLCPIIIDTLKKIYCLENLQENQLRAPYLQIIIPTYAQILFQLLFRMMKCSKNSSEGFQGMGVPHKLVTEEKITFEFIESLNDVVRRNDQTHLHYLKFLMQFTEYDYQEPHSEAFIRRTFSILNSIILRGKVSNDILKDILPILYDRIEYLINLRYNNDACMALVFPSKGSQTLFYTVGLYAMHISSFLINPKHFKQRMTAHYKQTQEQQRGPGGFTLPSNLPASQNLGAATGSTGGGFTGLKSKLNQNMSSQQQMSNHEDFIASNDIMFSEQLEFSIVDPAVIFNFNQDPELKQMVWERVIPLARSNLLFNPERVSNHNKAVVEDVVKSSQDLDMQVMNFITNSLLPNCSDINDKEFQQSLVFIIDNGCNSVYSSQRLSQGSSSTTGGAFGNSLSKFCLNNLFELCRFQIFKCHPSTQQDVDETQDQNAQRKIYEIRRKIATITTPVLINRCRDTLRKYVADEQKSGSTTLPRQRVSEAVFILEKLRLLDCYPEVQVQQYKSKKGHLVQLMPIFADLVLSNEVSLKEHLRMIFLDISEAIAQQNQTRQEAMDEENKVGDSSGGEF